MTFAAALAMGGELALTLWAMVTGWAACLLVFVLARRQLSLSWSLALAIILLTTPAVLYGGGNGQVEIRSAAFVLASILFMISAHRNASYRLFALAGICAGFYLGAKFYGLIFVGASGLVVLCNRDGLRRGLVFGAAAILAGFQWYYWNWLHTGDPVFPILTSLFQLPDTLIWTREFGRYFTETVSRGELVLDRSLLNWLIYPVLSIFNIAERLEGGRTGFGIFSLLIFPLAIAGLFRADQRRREFIIPLSIAFIFFTVWFFSGTAQRTRHLLPIYPLILIGLFPAAVAFARRASLVAPLVGVIAITLAVQLGGQAIFSANYARYVFSGETREEFYGRNVPGANAAQWINRELPQDAKLGFMNRQLAYSIDRPNFMMHPHLQVIVDSSPNADEEQKFIAQVQKQGLTHFLISGNWQKSKPATEHPVPFFAMIQRLVNSGCLHRVHGFNTIHISSRTLKSFGGADVPTQDTVLELVAEQCPGLK
ncbi:MAG: glycosyltransferase family 39 protein [Woeseiaceae bacterium]|nr:glycosyltransferase family 39 protein [Woeseiaceae bacterium]